MSSILVVDESNVERNLIAGLLVNRFPCQVDFADSPIEALRIIHQSQPEIVITELLPSENECLQFLCEIRRRFPDTQVILMTASGSESLAARALFYGATSYVPKSMQAEMLGETVQRLLERRQLDRLHQQLQGCLLKSNYDYSLDTDHRLIRPLIQQVQQSLISVGMGDSTERIRIGIALEEAVKNAMLHGNLELTSAEIAAAQQKVPCVGTREIFELRKNLLPFRLRKIRVEIRLTREFAEFTVEDEGQGFDVDSVIHDANVAKFETGRLRGLTMMQTFMDDVKYNDAGNCVTLFKRQKLALAIPA